MRRGLDLGAGELGDTSEASRSSTTLVIIDGCGLRLTCGKRSKLPAGDARVKASAVPGLLLSIWGASGAEGGSSAIRSPSASFLLSPRRRNIMFRAAIRSPPVTVLLLVIGGAGLGEGDRRIGSGDSLPPVSLWKAIIRPAALFERMSPARMASRLGKGDGEVGVAAKK